MPAIVSPNREVLIADSGPIQSQLFARALKVRREFQVSAVALETSALQTSCNPVTPTWS
jgi:hypothetical protein